MTGDKVEKEKMVFAHLSDLEMAFNDAMIYGSGFVFVPNDGGEPRHVDPRDVVLEPADAKYQDNGNQG